MPVRPFPLNGSRFPGRSAAWDRSPAVAAEAAQPFQSCRRRRCSFLAGRQARVRSPKPRVVHGAKPSSLRVRPGGAQPRPEAILAIAAHRR